MDKTELRLDPLTREWTIFNEGRALAPEFGPATAGPFAESPFRSGLERYAPHSLHEAGGPGGWQVRVVPNRVPILRVEGDHTPNGNGFYQHLDGIGAHEIVVEDPADRRFEELQVAEAAMVVNAWRARIEDLMRDSRLVAFSVLKSVGLAAGQTIAHSISQVFAMAVIPGALRAKLDSAKAWFATEKKSLFAGIIEHEQRSADRLVYENAGFLAFCPYAARAPFEVSVWPKRPCPDFHHINGDEVLQFTDALLAVLRKLNHALNHPAYYFALTTAPSRAPVAGHWDTLDEDFRWHVTITPRLHTPGVIESATGCHVNGVWPEVAADVLRQQEVQP